MRTYLADLWFAFLWLLADLWDRRRGECTLGGQE
jgi:hypothetical protein